MVNVIRTFTITSAQNAVTKIIYIWNLFKYQIKKIQNNIDINRGKNWVWIKKIILCLYSSELKIPPNWYFCYSLNPTTLRDFRIMINLYKKKFSRISINEKLLVPAISQVPSWNLDQRIRVNPSGNKIRNRQTLKA